MRIRRTVATLATLALSIAATAVAGAAATESAGFDVVRSATVSAADKSASTDVTHDM